MAKQSVKKLQKLIVESGVKLKYGIDGVYGNATSQAIDNMQVPNWIKTAMKEIGTTEVRGIEHDDRVLEYHAVSGGFTTDEVPWCGSYVNWVMSQHEFHTPKYPARAKSWLSFGISSHKPVVGSIAVKSRQGGGHVCFVIGEDSRGYLYCLGGNQNDEVNIRLYPRDVFLDFRVPPYYVTDELPRYVLGVSGDTREA